jgi:hypothetical protein
MNNDVLRPLGAAASLVFCVGLDRPAFAEGQALPHLRLPFIANEGQIARQVAYYATTSVGTVFVTARGELVYRLHDDGVGADRERRRESSITERPVGGTARPVGRDRTGTRVAYFLGRDSARWRSGVRTYEQVDLGEVWPGVTVTLRARERDVEKVFTVRPGGSVERIRIRVGGAHALGLDGEGAVTARTASGRVTFTAHPGHLYLGGPESDDAKVLTIAPDTGDVYVAGETWSHGFPRASGGAQPLKASGFNDAFVARVSSSLTEVKQATYLGGTGFDSARALAIAPETGDVYVAGSTSSNDFPGAQTFDGAQRRFGGGFVDGFVARLSSGLTELQQATYLGGSQDDEATALAIAPGTGDVYVAGRTNSVDFPRTSGGALPFGGFSDAFVARFPRDLTALTQATYLGSTRYENAWALAIAPATGDVYVAGATDSPDFPAARGGAQPVGGMAQAFGVADAFVSRLTPSLAPVDTPSLTARISINQPTFGTAQTLSTSMSLDNPGGAGAADLYLGGLLPDGVTIVFWTGAGNFAVGSLADIRTFRPYAAGVSLSTPFSRDMPGWVSHVWAPDDPRGRYIVFNLATKAGALAGRILTRDEILALATASFFLR